VANYGAEMMQVYTRAPMGIFPGKRRA